LADRADAEGETLCGFRGIEAQGVDAFLGQIRDELVGRTYLPLPGRRQEIPKDGGKVRVLSIPAVRDLVVQGALSECFSAKPWNRRCMGTTSGLLLVW
jgi:hypothetical protein